MAWSSVCMCSTNQALASCTCVFLCLLSNMIPEAALATYFWVGKFPDHLQDTTAVERSAAFPVRVKGHAVALESRKVKNISGSAQRSLRGTSVIYSNNSSFVATELPMAVTGVLDMFTITRRSLCQLLLRFVGLSWPTHKNDKRNGKMIGEHTKTLNVTQANGIPGEAITLSSKDRRR